MNNHKHTPAPWTAETDKSLGIWRGTIRLAVVHMKHPNNLRLATDFDEETANARLIALAPEILAALEALQDAFQHVEGNTKGNKAKTDIIKYNPDIRDALNAARELRWRLEKE